MIRLVTNKKRRFLSRIVMMKSMPEIILRSYSTGESGCSDKANTLRDAALIQT